MPRLDSTQTLTPAVLPGTQLTNDETLETRVKRKFKAIEPFDLKIIDSRAKGISDGRKLDFYSADERDNPAPGRLTVEVFDPSFTGEALENIIAADFLHFLGKNDANLVQLRGQFRQAMTEEQKAIDRQAYARAVQGGSETRPFDQWFDQHRLDQYLGAGLLPKGSANRADWMRILTPEQKEIQTQIEQYLRTGKVAPTAIEDAFNTTRLEALQAERKSRGRLTTLEAEKGRRSAPLPLSPFRP